MMTWWVKSRQPAAAEHWTCRIIDENADVFAGFLVVDKEISNDRKKHSNHLKQSFWPTDCETLKAGPVGKLKWLGNRPHTYVLYVALEQY